VHRKLCSRELKKRLDHVVKAKQKTRSKRAFVFFSEILSEYLYINNALSAETYL
jgi:hypothetical protein